jgi:hypothetical protein
MAASFPAPNGGKARGTAKNDEFQARRETCCSATEHHFVIDARQKNA